MLDSNTNFACLMDLLDIKSVEICKETGADKTLVSRWRSGKRKLTPQGGFTPAVIGLLIQADEARTYSVLSELLHAYYPTESLGTPEKTREALARWLYEEGSKAAEFQKDKAGILGRLMKRIELLSIQQEAPKEEIIREEPVLPTNAAAFGVEGVQGTALMYCDLIMKLPEPQDIIFVCPEGLEMFTRDMKFGDKLMDTLMSMFAAGHTLRVILRTDYKMTDVSLFSGRWLVAHLLGYIKSYYFDDFQATYHEKMLSMVRDKIVFRVFEEDAKILSTVSFDAGSVSKAHEECEGYLNRSKIRFHYSLFEHPNGFLQNAHPQSDRQSYQFARLPHFGLTDKKTFQESFQLEEEEMELLAREFPPLLFGVEQFDEDIPVRHIFCEDDIEEALLKARHGSPELSAITGRRVLMTTQKLVDQLIHIKALLDEHKNYEVCFLPDDVFKKLTMQILVYADRAAIGWVAGGTSTACRDYTNVNALCGFCDFAWNKIPTPARMRRAALSKINTWMRKAKKYGLEV